MSTRTDLPPADELPVLESLITIRNRLTALKKDRTEYVKPKDVLDVYAMLMTQVTRLNEIRSEPVASTSEEEPTPRAENRVDSILNEDFQLLSLFYLVLGKSRESPATFCMLVTMKRLLTHLTESGIYTELDLVPFQNRLAELKVIIEEGRPNPGIGPTPPANTSVEDQREEAMSKLLLKKWDDCERLLQKLLDSLVHLDPELAPIHQRLIHLRRLLASIAARPKPTAQDIASILTELRAIEDKRVGGKFVVDRAEGEGGGEDAEPFVPEKGQELLAGLLEDNFDICQDITAREGAATVANGPLGPIYERLSELKSQLERLVLTHRWTLRETDLFNYQMGLQEIDSMRVDGKFRDADGNVPKGQIVLLYLLRRCFGLTFKLMSSSEPISESLMPVANRLTTVKRCLIEVQKFGGPYSGMDLYPYQLALHQIDELRTDGKFLDADGGVPEGQAILNALLSEAHELIAELQEEGAEE